MKLNYEENHLSASHHIQYSKLVFVKENFDVLLDY